MTFGARTSLTSFFSAVLKTEQALESAKAAKDRHTHSANEAFIAAQGACEKTFLDATEVRHAAGKAIIPHSSCLLNAAENLPKGDAGSEG